MGEIYVEGTASRTVDYDRMKIEIDFFSREKTTAEAAKHAFLQCQSFLKRMEEIGISPERFRTVEDVATGSYGDRQDNNQVEHSLVLEAPLNMALLNTVIDTIIDNELDVRYEVSYQLSNEEKLHEELTREAFRDSRRKAMEIAELMGAADVELVKVTLDRNKYDEWEDDECCDFSSILLCASAIDVNYLSRVKPAQTTETKTISAVWSIE